MTEPLENGALMATRFGSDEERWVAVVKRDSTAREEFGGTGARGLHLIAVD